MSRRSSERHDKHNRYSLIRGQLAGSRLEWPVFEARFKRRLRVGVIGVDARGLCVVFRSAKAQPFAEQKATINDCRRTIDYHNN
jgi:hypothetical protein